MLTQFANCLQGLIFDFADKGQSMILGSFLCVYCLVLFIMTTKWVVQAPIALLISQASLYIANHPSDQSDFGEILSILILNSVLPTLIFMTSYSQQSTKISLFMQKMKEAISQIEMKNIMKMVPQAILIIDDQNEEVLHFSEAFLSLFGQSVETILPQQIFEIKEATEQDNVESPLKGKPIIKPKGL